MARISPSNIDVRPQGKLVIEEPQVGLKRIYFIPPDEIIQEAKMYDHNLRDYKRLILEIDTYASSVIIYPINTLTSQKDFLNKKYAILESITLKEFDFAEIQTEGNIIDLLDNLPKAFIKDYNYGLGLRKDYRFIVNVLKDLNIKHLVISEKDTTSLDEENASCTFKYAEFDQIRKAIDRTTREASVVSQLVKKGSTYNLLAYFLKNEKYPQKRLDLKDGILAKLIAKSSPIITSNLSEKEQKEVINLVVQNATEVLRGQPEQLMKLHNDIELINLEDLINKFEGMLDKKLSEEKWQHLFNNNPFILNLAFGYPIIKIQEKAFVGGRRLSGAGDKITDFLVKNLISNNAAIFEIKTPNTVLLKKTAYRERIYAPSSSLTGAINQILDQKYRFQKEVVSIKDNSRIYDLESYSVQGILVIGQMPKEVDQKKSFELFRGNSKDISIITFDELLTKLKQLHHFLLYDIEVGDE